MQFTGLLDKNGKEIYEGDVVRSEEGAHSEVKFEKGCFTVWDLDRDFFGPVPYLKNFTVDVVGNIYENPELLPNKP